MKGSCVCRALDQSQVPIRINNHGASTHLCLSVLPESSNLRYQSAIGDLLQAPLHDPKDSAMASPAASFSPAASSSSSPIKPPSAIV